MREKLEACTDSRMCSSLEPHNGFLYANLSPMTVGSGRGIVAGCLGGIKYAERHSNDQMQRERKAGMREKFSQSGGK